jgi:aspartate carbamoyltransferase regulatory subunit
LDVNTLTSYKDHTTVQLGDKVSYKIVKDGALVEKKHLTLPKQIRDVLKCKNPRCITSVEQELPHIFNLTDPRRAVYRCVYCETKAE